MQPAPVIVEYDYRKCSSLGIVICFVSLSLKFCRPTKVYGNPGVVTKGNPDVTSKPGKYIHLITFTFLALQEET